MPAQGTEANGLNVEIFLTSFCVACAMVTAIASYFFGLESQRNEHHFMVVFGGPLLWILLVSYIVFRTWESFKKYWKISLIFGIVVEYFCYHLSESDPLWPFFIPFSLMAGVTLAVILLDFLSDLWDIFSGLIAEIFELVLKVADSFKGLLDSTARAMKQCMDLISKTLFSPPSPGNESAE